MDVAKAIAMLFIIITHVLQRTLPGYVDGWGSSVLLVLGVPVFFFLSGSSHGRRNCLTPLGLVIDILKRGFAYFLPIIWFLAFRVWFYGQWSDFSNAFGAFLDNPSYGLWVLWILSWLVLLLDLGLAIPTKNKWIKKGICTSFIAIGYVVMIILRNTWVLYSDLFLGYDLFIYYTPFFVLGIWVGEIWDKKKTWWLELSFLIAGLLIVILASCFNEPFIRINRLEHLPIYYLACLGGTITILGVSGLISRAKWSKPISYAGQFTLEAYMLHLTLL
ncbi:MAG: acyltransferase, partial [Bacilli bacterium]|nr:acyltransferase [Bacilli bacterium]